jgi:hypothetical protein
MAPEEDDDLYDEEFDFVDDDDEEDGEGDEAEVADERQNGEDVQGEDASGDEGEEPVDEYGRPEPAANYVVHIYEHKKFKRTIERPFTPEDAEAFATEFNRTSKNYGRFALTSKNDAKPKKALD